MKKMNNKGFSLVELIIVIAIMAILVGVLAPQYLKYVEKSRKSSDMDQLDSIYTACSTAAGDADITDAPLPGAGTVTASCTSATSWGSEVLDTLGTSSLGSLTWKSSAAGKGMGTPDISIDASGKYTVVKGTLSVSSGTR